MEWMESSWITGMDECSCIAWIWRSFASREMQLGATHRATRVFMGTAATLGEYCIDLRNGGHH